VKALAGGSSGVMLAEVRTLAGEYVNAVLVRQGFARWSVKAASSDQELMEAQDLARKEQLGVWNPAIIQLVEDKRRENMGKSDDEIANMAVDPEEEDSKGA